MEHVDELIAAHALRALDADDERRVERHLAECERCRDELRQYDAVAGALAYAAPAAAAPRELRERLLAAIPAPPRPAPVQAAARWWWWPRSAMVAVPALAAAVVALALWNVSLRGDLGSLHDHLATSGTAHMQGVGNLIAQPGGTVTLYGRLQAPPPGKVYEAWVIAGGKPLPAGIFRAGGTFQLRLTRRAKAGDVVAITVEPAGGDHRRPSGSPISTARLRAT